MNDFPKSGDKLKYLGVPKYYYPCFTDMKTRAESNLVTNKEYIVSKVEIFSSWCAVELEGVEGKYNLGFFDYRNIK